MESAWTVLVRRLAVGDSVFTFDEVQDWDESEFKALVDLGLLLKSSRLTHITCDCPFQHIEKVAYTPQGNPVIPCSYERTDVGVDPARLQSWKASPARLAELLAQEVAACCQRESVTANHVWHIGRNRRSGRFREFFFGAIGRDDLASTLDLICKEWGDPLGVLLLPFLGSLEPGRTSRLTLIDLVNVTTLCPGRVLLNLDYIGDQLEEAVGAPSRRKSRCISIPPGTPWSEILMVVDDGGITVHNQGQVTEIGFEEAGFGARDQQLELLKVLAAAHGKVPGDKIADFCRSGTPAKTRFARLRARLCNFIPIDGTPIEYYKGAEMYVCRFQITTGEGVAFRMPAGTTWLDCRFHERHDGRIVVSVPEKKVLGAPQRRRGEEGTEAWESEETVAHVVTLEQIGLRNQAGRLSKEGILMIELLREGKLTKPDDPIGVLNLARLLREWLGIDGDPFQYSEASNTWAAHFECSSELKHAR